MSTAQSTNNTRNCSAAASSNNAVSGEGASSGVSHGGGRGGKSSLLVAGNIVQKISRDIRCVTGASSSMASEIQSRTRQLLRQQHERMQQEREEMKEEVHARASHNKKLKKSNENGENGEASLTPHAGEESDENVSGEKKKQPSSQQQPSSIPVVSTIQANAITNRELAQQLDEFKRQKRILQLRLKEQNAARQALLDVAEQHQHQNPTDINSAQRKIQDAAEALVLDTTLQQQGDETSTNNTNNNNKTGVTPAGPFSPKSVAETPQNGKNNNKSTPTSRPVSPSTTTTAKNDIVKTTTRTTAKSLFDQTNFGNNNNNNNNNKTSTSESLQNKDQQTGQVQTGLEDHEDSLTRNKQRTHSTNKNNNSNIDITNNNNNTIQVLDEDPDAPYAVGPVLCKPVGGKYIPVRRLGAGSFGEVYIVYWQPSDQAVNAIRQRQMQDRERLQRELERKREEIIALQRRDETDPTHQDNGPDQQQQQQQQQQLNSSPSSIPSANYSKAKYRDGTTLGTSENGKNNNNNNTIIGGGNNSALNNNQIVEDSDDNLDNQPLLDVPVSPYATSPAGLVSGLASTALTVNVTVSSTENAGNDDQQQQQLHFPRENIFVCKVEPDNALKERQQEVKDGLRTDKTETEEYVLANCAHPNIVGFVDEFSHDERKYLVMEYVDGGDLKQEINRRANGEIIRYIAEESVLFLAVQVLLAMEYLHRHNILHRDLKSANILLSKKWMVKLGDFGFAKHYTYDVDGAVDTSTLGTPYYIAPEVYKRKPYGEKAEMFAFGVILYELVALHRPFREDDLTTIVRSILFDHPKPIRRSNISLELLRVIDSLLQKDPTKRPSAKECLRMEVFQKPLQHYLRRVKKVANDPAVGTELDKVWFRVLAEHIDTIYDDNMSSSKSRFRMSRSRSRDKEAISNSSRASSRTSAYSTDRSSRSSSEGGGSNNNNNKNSTTSKASRRIIGGGSSNKRKSSQDRRGGGGSTNVATSRNQ